VLVQQAFAGIDPKDIEIARKVLAKARENAGRSAATNRASNQ
jgi:MarR family transcriptional regulator, transcriptional regulator for hemolysin